MVKKSLSLDQGGYQVRKDELSNEEIPLHKSCGRQLATQGMFDGTRRGRVEEGKEDGTA